MNIHIAKPEHEVAYQDMVKLINTHASHITGIELLAIAANMIGKLIALQDQRHWTSETIMKVVTENLRVGNQQAINAMLITKGNA